jgi:uncharacterized protein (TIGR03086 family)
MLQDLRVAADWAATIFDRVDVEQQASSPTPCTDWTVLVLMTHVVAWNRLYAAGLLGVRPPDEITTAALATTPGATEPVPDLIHRSPGHAYRTSTHELLAVFGLDPALEGTCRLPVGELPAHTAFTIALVENIVHGWDLAVATDQDTTIPDDLVTVLERAVADLPVERNRGTRFAPARGTPNGATRQQLVLGHLGRRA